MEPGEPATVTLVSVENLEGYVPDRYLEVKLTHGTPSAGHPWRTRCSKRLDSV